MTESATRPTDSDPRFLAPVRTGETVGGKYVVRQLLGLGGMGAVFEAHDERLDRRVALKVLLPRLVNSPTAASRFKREAKAATRITSEHVVKVVEISDLPDGTPFLVMEYLEGKDLRAVLRESGPLPPPVAVDYLLQALQAVAEGHLAAIIHRDLKPSNLFLTERADGSPLIKVLDFGIAKTLQPDSTEDFSLTNSDDLQLGSPTYMPPEQFTNPRDVDARADIWSLGVTLYELISGKVPFRSSSYPELVGRVLNAAPEPLTAAAPGFELPPELGLIVAKCLEKDREQRYKNAMDLAIALAPFGSDDARLSLTRVSGLSRLRTPVPVSPVGPPDAYDATLPVAVDPLLRPHSYTSSGARGKAPRAPRGRLWVALGALAALAVFAALLLSRAPVESARSHSGSAARSALPEPLAAPLTPPPPQPTEANASAKTAPDFAASHALGGAGPSKTSVGAAATLSRHQLTTPTAKAPALADSIAVPAQPQAPSAVASQGTPDELIESLIRERH